MAYYPIFVELEGKRVLVVGGGHVAEEKVQGLLRAEAAGRLRLVAPAISESLSALSEDGKIEWLARPYEEGDMAGFDFVMIATDDGKVNAEIAAEGKRRKIWVNAADDPANCDFILPAVVRQGPVVLAASTSGASPALARRLREELTDFLSEDFAALAELLDEVRHELRGRGVRPDPEAWQKAIDGQLRALLAQRRWGQARARLLRSLGVANVFPTGVEYEDDRPPIGELGATGISPQPFESLRAGSSPPPKGEGTAPSPRGEGWGEGKSSIHEEVAAPPSSDVTEPASLHVAEAFQPRRRTAKGGRPA